MSESTVTLHQLDECLAETQKHIRSVGKFINMFVRELLRRVDHHDDSKLVEPELSIFASNQHKLANTVYGTPEYEKIKDEVKVAIEHHHANNRHHPEHFPGGIEDMTLVDVLEMLCDWKASTARMQNGNIRKSVEVNAQRFNISPQLRKILENTVREYFTE